MSIQAHIINVKEIGEDVYVLPDGAVTLAAAKQLLAHRAEELIDELTASDVEQGIDAEYTLTFALEGAAAEIVKKHAEGGHTRVANLDISVINLVDFSPM